jgi:hypothetical protein
MININLVENNSKITASEPEKREKTTNSPKKKKQNGKNKETKQDESIIAYENEDSIKSSQSSSNQLKNGKWSPEEVIFT